MNRRKPAAVRRYDFFKFVVALILMVVAGVLAWRGGYIPWIAPPSTPVGIAALTPTMPLATDTPFVSVMATPTVVPTATPLSITAPTLNSPATPDAQGRITLQGTGTPGSVVQIVADGEALAEVTVAGDGTWTYRTTLSPGDHQIQARALDDEGTTIAESKAVALAVPTATPLPITAPTLDSPATPDAEGRVTLEGTGTPSSTVQIVVDGEVLEDVIVDQDGTWVYTTTLSSGEHQLQARALDDAEEVVAESQAVMVAVSMPVTALTLTTPTESDAEGPVTLTGTGAPSGTVQIVANREVLTEVIVAEDGTWVYTTTLSSGEHRLQARALDDTEEVIAETDVVTFSMPALALQTPVILTPTQGITLTAGVVEIGGSGSPTTVLEVLLDDEVISTTTVPASGIWTISHVIPTGVHSLAVRMLDDPESLSQSLQVNIETGVDEAATAEDTEPPSETAEDEEGGCGVGEIRDGTYVVAACEYIALIAERAGVTVEALLAANPDLENPDLIYPGQVLNLPPSD